MSRTAVIYFNNDTSRMLYVTDISRSSSGLSGWVENGVWELRIKGVEGMALEAGNVRQRWKITSFHMIPVPVEHLGHYTDVLKWAREVLASGPGTLPPAPASS
jgi:hypothetical protein